RMCGSSLLQSSTPMAPLMFWYPTFIVLFWCIGSYGYETGFQSRPFEGIEGIPLVECTVTEISKLVGLELFDVSGNNSMMASVNYHEKECNTKQNFASCILGTSAVVLSVVITDLAEGETRNYRCTAAYYDSGTRTVDYYTTATRLTTTTTVEPPRTTTGAAVRAAERDDVLYFATLGVGATLVVVVAIDIIAVVCLWRRQWKMPCRGTDDEELIPPIRENPTPADNRPAQEEEPQSPDGDIRDVSDEAASDGNAMRWFQVKHPVIYPESNLHDCVLCPCAECTQEQF
ncbi:hypothetical protein BaRGS_00019836, partial [Batillaria attramentaria]